MKDRSDDPVSDGISYVTHWGYFLCVERFIKSIIIDMVVEL